jgi:hypothetical protein
VDSARRITLDDLRREHERAFAVLLETRRPYRGRQRPRDREETRLLIALAIEAWRRAEADGRIRRLPTGGLAYEVGRLRGA